MTLQLLTGQGHRESTPQVLWHNAGMTGRSPQNAKRSVNLSLAVLAPFFFNAKLAKLV
jgi:hypothetical protein